ncbi:MAG TPA: FdhF/YdeP family oxidoreductase [Gemmataceae bacterium]|jgi:molybdopterin-dependent oxidoreductase alpha subunit
MPLARQGNPTEILSMKRMTSGGGWAAILYTLRMANRVGWRRLWRAMRAKNACKTCALGMGGQKGGMRNEAGHWPEVCKKSFQAMVADMQGALRPDFFRTYGLEQLKALSPRELEWSGRLTQPVYTGPGDTHYRVIGWDEALARVADQLKRHQPDETFFYASGRSSNEAGFLLQLFARLYGTNYVNNCSYYCHQASGVGLGRSLGTGTATVTLEDVEHCDLFFLIGGNPASNHPRMLRTLMQVRRNGGHVVVINPVKEVGLVNFRVPSDVRSLLFGSKIASLYVQPHIGGDIALLTGVAKLLLERGQTDGAFISSATEGFEGFRRQVEATDWDAIERGSGVARATITRLADLYATAKNAVFGWTMGITHHTHGVENVRMIVNLALLRGMAGRPHAGLLPIRGHSNVQGIGSVGVAPQLKQAVLDRLESLLGVKLPTQPGLDTMTCMQAAAAGRVKSALCLGGNLYGANPDAAFAGKALNNLELVTYLSTTLNTGHVWGRGRETLVLPVRARDEEGPTTQESMFNYVRLSDGGPARYDGPRSEVSVIAEVGRRVLGDSSPVDWSAMHKCMNIRQVIAKAVPGFEGLATIDQTKQEFQIPGRTFHTPRFGTPSGKAQFAAVPIPSPAGGPGELRMMTIRSEGQFNTVVYEEADIYRGQERRDVILMNAADIRRLGLEPDQAVTVRSAAGAMHDVRVRPFDITAGNTAMYFPEANVLVPTATDPASKTPAFKAVPATVEPAGVVGDAVNGRRALAVLR